MRFAERTARRSLLGPTPDYLHTTVRLRVCTLLGTDVLGTSLKAIGTGAGPKLRGVYFLGPRLMRAGSGLPYRSSVHGSPRMWYPFCSQKPGKSASISSIPRTHFADFQR